jgi:hypothetical protein
MAKIFFAYPYSWDDSEPEYKIALKAAVKRLGHTPVIASEVPTDLPLLQHIRQLIEEAEVGFFDITGLNPNVLVEFGIGYSADTKAILLENAAKQFVIEKSMFGERRVPIETPSDLRPFVRYPYDSTRDLAEIISTAIHTHLPQETAVISMRDKIRQIVSRSGPINMSGIATASKIPIDDVRPILKGLVALNEVHRVGSGPGTKYKMPGN